MTLPVPAYLNALKTGTLEQRADQGLQALSHCTLCPRHCSVNRMAGETGICNTGRGAVVAAYNAHFGEETPLVGHRGSGTIFFTHCNLRCNFCQNYEISQLGEGRELDDDQLAAIMLELQQAGCHNINLVTPSHVVPRFSQLSIWPPNKV
jgi:putative pyruvate formate lyase activating enzyme